MKFFEFFGEYLDFPPLYEKKMAPMETFVSIFIGIYKGYKIWVEQHVSINAQKVFGQCVKMHGLQNITALFV